MRPWLFRGTRPEALLPRKSYTQRKKGLELSLAKLQGKREDAVRSGATTAFTTEIDGEIAQLQRHRASFDTMDAAIEGLRSQHRHEVARDKLQAQINDLRKLTAELKQFADAPEHNQLRQAERKMTKLQGEIIEARAGRGRDLDPFRRLVIRSPHLTAWHMSIGLALLDLLVIRAGQSGSGMVSGAAGDGDGNLYKGILGDLGDEYWGAIGVPGVSGKDPLQNDRPSVHKPKNVKAQRKVSDGGLSVQTDAARKRDRMWSLFAETAESYGLSETGRVGYGMTCVAVLTGYSPKTLAFTRFVQSRKITQFLDYVDQSMAAGLEAVSTPLGVPLSG